MNQEKLAVALEQVRLMADYVASGQESLARQARRTLDDLCWSPTGYPPSVKAALERAGLRSTP